MARSGGGARGTWIAALVGIAIGIGLGLFYTWELDPVIERNTAPWQLSDAAREDYVIAVAMSYAYNGDLTQAFDRLRAVAPDRNVWQMVADIACERHKSIQIASNSDILVMRALEQLYRPQGAQGCADVQFPTPAPVAFSTPTPLPTLAASLPPQPTKTPVPEVATVTVTPEPLPTSPPSSERFIIARVESFCDPDLDGVLEVRQRVKHDDQRRVPVLLEQVAGPAGQPVVRVNEVVVRALTNRERGDVAGELRQVAEEAVLVDRLGRAGFHLDQPNACVDLDHLRSDWIGPACEDVYGNAPRREMAAAARRVDQHDGGRERTAALGELADVKRRQRPIGRRRGVPQMAGIVLQQGEPGRVFRPWRSRGFGDAHEKPPLSGAPVRRSRASLTMRNAVASARPRTWISCRSSPATSIPALSATSSARTSWQS